MSYNMEKKFFCFCFCFASSKVNIERRVKRFSNKRFRSSGVSKKNAQFESDARSVCSDIYQNNR